MKIKQLLFTLVGIASSILGIVCFDMSSGSYEYNSTYGGDAYTGIQNAAAQTANNVHALAEVCKFGFGSILLIAGIVIIIYAITLKNPTEYIQEFKKIKFNGNSVPSLEESLNISNLDENNNTELKTSTD